MTWEELVEKVKDIEDIEIRNQYSITGAVYQRYIYYNGLCFFQDGNISCDIYDIAGNRTPDQMYAIITAITETKESK